MLEFTAYAVVMLGLGIWDIRSMLKKKHKRELIPYIVLSITAIVIGYINFSHPYQQGIVDFLLDLIKAKR
ncbi:MAG: hypothetical protein GX942_03370 [Papillibacter sp.]|jgi:UDP-N-acetylmuramyl pentapeptide phosphotransferase/UDP-N-acetylglucosamine-1-phosphate transferase|nr:hypothetical protein [Papillibacter sp.]